MRTSGLSNLEVMRVVEQYIGVDSGYLGDFSYRTHAEFYPLYCRLSISPADYEGTTRETFIEILLTSAPPVQAKILRGVIERFPLKGASAPPTRTAELHDEIRAMIDRLERVLPVASPSLGTTSEAVDRAIDDVDTLLQTGGAISGIDRIHTALHGYLRLACDSASIAYSQEDSLAKLLKVLRQHHPAMQDLGPKEPEIGRVLQALGTVLDALNPIRNTASVAHPNEALLGEEEARLVINVGRAILCYLDAKLSDPPPA
jgi:hypothetical protein